MNAVLVLVRLHEMGLLDRIKKCEYCERWLFGRFAHQRFCSGGKCREKAFQSSPSAKEKRREWARKNYWAKISLETGRRIEPPPRRTKQQARKSKGR